MEVLPLFEHKVHHTVQGESIVIDEVQIHFLFSYHKALINNLMNNMSVVLPGLVI